MRAASRFLATVLAAVVWVFAGLSVASGTLVPKAITPASFDATAAAWIPGAD
jgi:hypothetical protein